MSANSSEPGHIVDALRLRDFVMALFAATGLPEQDAGQVAYALVRANLRGVDTHGVFRTPTYLKRLRQGLNNPHPNIAIKQVAHSASQVDGDNGMGAVVATRAMQEAIRMAPAWCLFSIPIITAWRRITCCRRWKPA